MSQKYKNDDQAGPARTAILFDAENFSWQLVNQAIALSAGFGKSILRAYADFSKPHTKGWEKPALRYGIRTIHQFSYDSKNSSSDFLMMHDAFKLVHSGKIDTFVIVTNDSDFITPNQLLRQSGAYVHGVGTKGKCASLLEESCDSFDWMIERSESSHTTATQVARAHPDPSSNICAEIIKQLIDAYQVTEKSEHGWVSLTSMRVNTAIRNSPVKKFSTLLKNSGCFELADNNKIARLLTFTCLSGRTT